MGRLSKSKYPVGATWEGVDEKTGKRAKIWLRERLGYLEVWNWSWCYPDGSYSGGFGSSDWATSYRMCKNMLPFDCRMKRVK